MTAEERTRIASVSGDQVAIPAELFEAMGEPRALALQPADEQSGRFIRPVGRLKARLAGRPVHRLQRVAATAVYLAPGADEPPGEYRIVNYHPAYYLLPAVDHDEFWRGIRDYHEHRPPARQEADAQRRSAWLADVLADLGDSFLEVGCGAGRNLAALRDRRPDAELAGLEVNASAASLAGAVAEITVGSLYDSDLWTNRPVDVVLTSGVLMHVPHERVTAIVQAATRVAARAVVHFELHGPAHGFDFHRYPRDYRVLYDGLGLSPDRYELFGRRDYRSRGVAPFHHALLVWTR